MLMDAHIIKQRDKGPGSEGFVGTLQYADGPVLYRGWGRALGESTLRLSRRRGCSSESPSAQTRSSDTLCAPPPAQGHPIA